MGSAEGEAGMGGNMKRYILIDNNTQKFFEQDFAGWSFQEKKKDAYKFKSLNDAQCAVDLLQSMGYSLKIEEE